MVSLQRRQSGPHLSSFRSGLSEPEESTSKPGGTRKSLLGSGKGAVQTFSGFPGIRISRFYGCFVGLVLVSTNQTALFLLANLGKNQQVVKKPVNCLAVQCRRIEQWRDSGKRKQSGAAEWVRLLFEGTLFGLG